MAARDGDIVDSQVTFMSTAQLKYVLLYTRSDDINKTAVILLLTQAF